MYIIYNMYIIKNICLNYSKKFRNLYLLVFVLDILNIIICIN